MVALAERKLLRNSMLSGFEPGFYSPQNNCDRCSICRARSHLAPTDHA
jgi:hypothetical protein